MNTLTFNLKMFDPKKKLIVVCSEGYESIIHHNHEFIELVYVESGSAKNFVNGKELKIIQDDFFIISDNSSHYIRPTCNEKEFKIINIIFDSSLFDIDYKIFSATTVYSCIKNHEIKTLFLNIKNEFGNKQSFYDEITKHLVGELLYKIGREKMLVKSKRKELLPSKDLSINSYLGHAVEYIHANYNNQLTVDEISYEVGLSKGYLQKLFKEQRNTSVIEYLITYRMEQSCKLLIETEYSIAVISNMVGFNDLKHFYKIFKRVFGTTPSEYRKNKENTDGACNNN